MGPGVGQRDPEANGQEEFQEQAIIRFSQYVQGRPGDLMDTSESQADRHDPEVQASRLDHQRIGIEPGSQETAREQERHQEQDAPSQSELLRIGKTLADSIHSTGPEVLSDERTDPGRQGIDQRHAETLDSSSHAEAGHAFGTELTDDPRDETQGHGDDGVGNGHGQTRPEQEFPRVDQLAQARPEGVEHIESELQYPQRHKQCEASSHDGGDGGPFDTHRVDRSKAEDQDRVENAVDHYTDEHHDTGRDSIPGRADDVVAHNRDDVKGHAEIPDKHVLFHVGDQFIRGAEHPKERFQRDQSDDHQDGDTEPGQHERIGGASADLSLIPGPDALGDQGHGADPQAQGECPDHHHNREGQRHGRQGSGPQLPDEIGINNIEGHHAEDAYEHGGREPHQG